MMSKMMVRDEKMEEKHDEIVHSTRKGDADLTILRE
jgi:hypothetical protein